MSELILTQVDAGVLTVTFNRPSKKNAFTHEMYSALTEALAAGAAHAEVKVVLLTGAGGAFTAGNDLADFLEHPPTGEASPVFQFLRTLAGYAKPVVAAVQGAAVGIGTTLLLHCDDVVVSDNARFSLPFVNLGLCPEGGASVLLPLAAGMPLASELLLLGEPFDAATALRARIASVIAPDASLHATARARALKYASRPAASLAATKALVREPTRAQVEAALSREGAVFMERLQSPEAKAAFAAFLQRK